MFRMTMLTFDILRRFEQEYKTDCYNDNERSTIETDARIAMINRHYHHEQGETWTENDIYTDFLRCLAIDKITLIPNHPEQPETEETNENETNEQEENTMYNYEETIKNDILDYIAENIDRADYIDDRDGLEEQLNDDLWTADSVTGNASGSYFCNAYRAREAFQNDRNAEDYFAEACGDFGLDAAEVGRHFIQGDYEWIDCTIRCYLLGQMISAVLDELENAGYFDESETDTSDIIDTVHDEIA